MVNPNSINDLTGSCRMMGSNRGQEAEVVHGRWGLLSWMGSMCRAILLKLAKGQKGEPLWTMTSDRAKFIIRVDLL